MTNTEWQAFLIIAESVSALVNERKEVCGALRAYDRCNVWGSLLDQIDDIMGKAFDERKEQCK